MPALALLLTLLWIVLTGGAASSWIVGVPAITAALLLSRNAAAPGRISLAGALRFAGFFLCATVRGGLDVAGRVSAPRLRIAPGLVHYRWRLPATSPARMVFALCVSLLPGTLVARLGNDVVLVHALDATAPVADQLAALEERVAGLFALPLGAPEQTDG